MNLETLVVGSVGLLQPSSQRSPPRVRVVGTIVLESVLGAEPLVREARDVSVVLLPETELGRGPLTEHVEGAGRERPLDGQAVEGAVGREVERADRIAMLVQREVGRRSLVDPSRAEAAVVHRPAARPALVPVEFVPPTNELGAGPPLVRREGVVLTFLHAGEVAGRPAAAHRPCPGGEEAGHPAGETHSTAGHPNLEEPAPQGLGGGNVGRDQRGPLLGEERLVSSTML